MAPVFCLKRHLTTPTVFYISVLISLVNSVSIWDPFCQDEKLYMPYVRIFHRGRQGAMLRDRGPGFIDVTGLRDIYVCTNGLVMMYHVKTTAMGEIFEHGELHWAPHHCELYNPSSNNGLPPDQPRKSLLSILLIGHPTDYREPALQMFVAPKFDMEYKGYINLTSLIMMGNDGECLIEKGMERGRLRVRNVEPPGLNDTNDNPDAPIFCQLDAQRQLGQRNFITLQEPGQGAADGPLYTPPPRPDMLANTSFERSNDGNRSISDTGSMVVPRFKASRLEAFKDKIPLAQAADNVYKALISDRKMRFVGCLHYPDFNFEQMRILENRQNESANLSDPDTTPGYHVNKEAGFWADPVKPTWSVEEEPKPRFTLFLKDKPEEEYQEALDAVKKAEEELEKAIQDAAAAQPPDKAKQEEVKKLEKKLRAEKLIYSLWPYKRIYSELLKYVKELQTQVKEVWEKVTKEVIGEQKETPTKVNWDDLKDEKLATMKANELQSHRHVVLQTISEKRFERRFDPYNPAMIKEYDDLLNASFVLNAKLRVNSKIVGPMISNAETLYSNYKAMKNLLKKSIQDLENAVKAVERSGNPAIFSGADPFDRYFIDTMIEITDAKEGGGDKGAGGGGSRRRRKRQDAAAGPPAGDAPKDPRMKACFQLPGRIGTCKAIKPTSKRAYQLLRNRQSKTKDWMPDDEWREKVLELVGELFMRICPYINEEFTTAINLIIKGYLLATPHGTGLRQPVIGTRLRKYNHAYQEIVYNKTYEEMNQTELYNGTLRKKDPFWDQIIVALEECKKNVAPLQFWHNEDAERSFYISLRKFFKNNSTEVHYDVDDLVMQEKADLEYAFNWAIDMNWRVFATVLGMCMPHYEKSIPLISARFYALYSQDFLNPLRQIWMSNRDNPVLKVILGSYYGTGKADRWAKICMESSFVDSGDRHYRPPRSLYVNAFTEMNFFTTGPMAGTSGMLSMLDL